MGRTAQAGRFREVAALAFINKLAVQTVSVAQALIAGALVVFVIGLLERTPPFQLISVEPAAARPGEPVTIRAKVARDWTRRCDAEFARYMFGEHNGVQTRYYLGYSTVSAQTIDAMYRDTPDSLVVTEFVPPTMRPGPAKVVADVTYRCNKSHAIWPIHMDLTLPFTVLP